MNIESLSIDDLQQIINDKKEQKFKDFLNSKKGKVLLEKYKKACEEVDKYKKTFKVKLDIPIELTVNLNPDLDAGSEYDPDGFWNASVKATLVAKNNLSKKAVVILKDAINMVLEDVCFNVFELFGVKKELEALHNRIFNIQEEFQDQGIPPSYYE